MNLDKRFSAPARFIVIMTEHYEQRGNAHRGKAKVLSWITARGADPQPSWDTGFLLSWDKELPPVGEPFEIFAKHQCEVYNGKLKDEYSVMNTRPAEVPESHASVPVHGSPRGGMGPSPVEVQQRMPPGATPTKHGPPDHGAYDLRDEANNAAEAPPHTDADAERSDWGF